MREREIFIEALEKTNLSERAALLDAACHDDTNLRERVEQLLAQHQRVESFILDTPPVAPGATVDHPISERPGTVIGPYKLLQQIGEGGMGVVFMAEQSQPIQRTVALKIIKPGMDSRQVIARFEAERQAVAMMDHPNIAKVFDAGATETGRPYFVMELVKGVPITKYCDDKHLPLRARLELFMQVCQAVQHAHQKGLIHRDIKPTNILVAEYDDQPMPKVIDFGVAKATAQRLTERTMFTEFGQLLGTMEYMSPEQSKFNQLDIDTRSDIYSLGVLLYELLAGSTPFEGKRLHEAAFDEMLRIIREEEPPKPSTRLSSIETLPSIAANRHTEPARLSKDVRGELDWIVMKALEKDRNRRYETASGFAADIERHLHDEPVAAGPPSAAYRFRKFARRNRAALFAASGVVTTLLLLVIGLAVSNRMIRAERNEKAAALADREKALALAKAESKRAEEGFLRASIAIREVMTKAAMGSGEWSLLPSPLRKRFAEESIKFYEGLLQESNPDPSLRYETAVGYRSIGAMHTMSGERAQAEKSFRRSVAILDRLVTEHPAVPQYRHQLGWSLLNLGRMLRNTQRSDEAKLALQRGIDLYETLLSETPSSFDYRNELATCYLELSRTHGDTRDFKPAAEAIHRGIELLESAASNEPDVPQYKEQLAGMHLSLGRLQAGGGQVEEARATFRTAAELYEKAFSATPTAGCLYGWSQCWKALLELPSAATQLSEMEQAYQHFFQVLSRAPPNLRNNLLLRRETGHIHRLWAFKLWSAGRLEEAERVRRDALIIFEKLITDEPDFVGNWHFAADTQRQVAELMIIRGDHEQAEQNFRRAIEIHEERVAKFPDQRVNDLDWAAAHFDLARLLIKFGRAQEAIPLVARGVEVSPINEGQAGKLTVQLQYANLLREAGEFDQALVQYAEVIATKPNTAEAWGGRGQCYLAKGEFAKAAEDFTEAIKLKPDESWYWHERGYCYLCLGQHEKAIADHSQSIALSDGDAGQRLRRGHSYRALGELQKAEEDYSRAIELNPASWETWYARARLYAQQHELEKARSDLATLLKLAIDPGAQNEVAWRFATDPDLSWRNAAMAVELAEKAIAARPADGMIWNTLGAARYRNGQWKEAIAAFEKSMELRGGGDSNDWFFLAMCHWQLGDKQAARKWYDRAVVWMDKNQPENGQLRRFRTEAEELLKITGEKPTTEPPVEVK